MRRKKRVIVKPSSPAQKRVLQRGSWLFRLSGVPLSWISNDINNAISGEAEMSEEEAEALKRASERLDLAAAQVALAIALIRGTLK